MRQEDADRSGLRANDQSVCVSEELLWQAFRYVSGEFNAVDEEAFEQRMLLDESLCVIVAEMAQLTEDISRVAPSSGVAPAGPVDAKNTTSVETIANSASRWSVRDKAVLQIVPVSAEPLAVTSDKGARRTAFLVSICSCLLLAMVVSSDVVMNGDSSLKQDAKAELLVDVWSRQESPSERRQEQLVPESSSIVAEDADEIESVSQVLEVPEWLLAAVTLIEYDEESAPDDLGSPEADL